MTSIEKTLDLTQRLGWRIVLLLPREKRPMGKTWRITVNPEEIRNHIEKTGGNIGLVCCRESGVAVLDFDDPKAEAEMMEALGPLPVTVVTGSGKHHCYVRWEPNLPAKILWMGRGVGEVQRGPNQEVVMPPSIHPKTGAAYDWVEGSEDPRPLPPKWRQYLQGLEPAPQPGPAPAKKEKKAPAEQIYELLKAKEQARKKLDSERPRPELLIQPASEIRRESLCTMFGGRLIRGAFQLLIGPGEAGKGMVSTDLIARLTQGRPFPGEPRGREPTRVLVCITEDSKERMRARLEAAGADLNLALFVDGPPVLRGGLSIPSPVAFDDDAGILVERARELGAQALFLETMLEHLGDREGKVQWSSNNEKEVRRAIGPIVALCREANLIGWGVMHPRKSTDGGIEDSISGSAAFRNIGRGVLHVYRDPDDESEWRLFLCSKANYLARRPDTLRFKIIPWDVDPNEGCVIWGSGRDLVDPRSAEDIWSEIQEARSKAAQRRRDFSVMEAEKFLQTNLEQGEKPVSELEALARDLGLSWKAVERAKARLGIESVKTVFQGESIWRFPAAEV